MEVKNTIEKRGEKARKIAEGRKSGKIKKRNSIAHGRRVQRIK